MFSVGKDKAIIAKALLNKGVRSKSQIVICPRRALYEIHKIRIRRRRTRIYRTNRQDTLGLIRASQERDDSKGFMCQKGIVTPRKDVGIDRCIGTGLALLPRDGEDVRRRAQLRFCDKAARILYETIPLSYRGIRPKRSTCIRLELRRPTTFYPKSQFIVQFCSPLRAVNKKVVLRVKRGGRQGFRSKILRELRLLRGGL